VLTVEHLRLTRRGGAIQRVPWHGLTRVQAEALVTTLSRVAAAHHGHTVAELTAALSEVDVDNDLQRGLRAAQKFVLDRCEFVARDDVDPVDLRQRVFAAAAAARREGSYDRLRVLAAVEHDVGLEKDTLSGLLYADLDEARLVDASALIAMNAAALVDRWDQAELQALLLRSLSVRLELQTSPRSLRALLRALKWQQLLFTLNDATADGVVIVVDGPASLFSQSTRYGLKLALVVPAILRCERVRLTAMVQLRKGQAALPFVYVGHRRVEHDVDDGKDTTLEDDVGARADLPLVRGLREGLPAALVALGFGNVVVEDNHALFSVPGVGACVPDVVVVADDGRRACVEVLGFWSRDAVFARVALAEAGLVTPTVFCISDRLRVSEAALNDDRACLLVFQGSLSPKRVAERIARLWTTTSVGA
jgi:predicted nuclease of restriction endonuclease-like RecB superfamily